jgi:hypothetical protein
VNEFRKAANAATSDIVDNTADIAIRHRTHAAAIAATYAATYVANNATRITTYDATRAATDAALRWEFA